MNMANLSQFAIPRKCEIPQGAYGVWQVPELDIMIPLYQGTNANAQKLVDKENCACIQKFGVGRIINDHAESVSMNKVGRWRVGEFVPDTQAFLVTKDVTYQYSCKYVCRAYRHTHAYILDGQSIYPRYATDVLCCGCATADAKEVYIACFKYVGKMPT